MEHLVLSCLESRVEDNRNLYGRFLLGPFIKGNALTVATALRRALLSEVERAAITAIDIQGITHEFSTIVGVRESVLEISLNFQQVVLFHQVSLKTVQIGYLQVQGPAVVHANDLKLPLGIECVDPTQYIATLSTEGLLVVKFLIGKGTKSDLLKRNNILLTAKHVQRAKKKLKGLPFKSDICLQNIIPLDPFLTTVHRVNFAIETDDLSNQFRERLIFEVWTNGSVSPRQAIHEAALSLMNMFSAFRSLSHLDSHSSSRLAPDQSLTNPVGLVRDCFGAEWGRPEWAFSRSISDSLPHRKSLKSSSIINLRKRLSFLYKSNLDKMSLLSSDLSNTSLSLKTYQLLKQKNIHKLDTLLAYSPTELLKVVNGNKNMFYDIKRCISTLGLRLL